MTEQSSRRQLQAAAGNNPQKRPQNATAESRQKSVQSTTGVAPQSITAEDRAIWPRILQTHPEANFLQSPEWARMNELIGHKVILEHFADVAWCLMIVKNAKRGRYLEIPGGPLVDWNDRALVRRLFVKIRKVAQTEGCVFVRLRPQLRAEDGAKLDGLGLKKAPMHLHAEHTVILDLTKDEEELLKNMRRQTRYEVRRADKLGLTVTSGNSAKLFEEFHAVQAATAARQNFVPPDLDTLLAEREAFGERAQIYVTKTAEGEAVAYGLIFGVGDEAEYFEAASTELNYKLPGAYALLWQAIRDLKKQGYQRFNLWGVAPRGQKNHRYSGVTTFKTGFGGEMVEFVPAQDLIVKRFRYLLDWLIETARKKHRHL